MEWKPDGQHVLASPCALRRKDRNFFEVVLLQAYDLQDMERERGREVVGEKVRRALCVRVVDMQCIPTSLP